MTLEAILSAFEDALELERELGTRTVELDRALLRKPSPNDSRAIASPNAVNASNALNAVNDSDAVNAANGVKDGDEAGAA